MNKIKRFEEFINEDSDQSYDYGCVMLYFDFPEMNKIHDTIDDTDIYTEDEDSSFGLETDSHITLLYGLHKGVTDSQVKDAISDIYFNECTLHNVSLFESEYDVLKFDVEGGDSLSLANEVLKKLPFTSDYPDFHPHCTISYLKKGAGSKYVKSLKSEKFKVTPTHIMYSKPDGEHVRIEL